MPSASQGFVAVNVLSKSLFSGRVRLLLTFNEGVFAVDAPEFMVVAKDAVFFAFVDFEALTGKDFEARAFTLWT